MWTLENKDKLFHCFLIWPRIAGLSPFEVLIRKGFLLLLLLGRSKDILDIFDMRIHTNMNLRITVRVFIWHFLTQLCPFLILLSNYYWVFYLCSNFCQIRFMDSAKEKKGNICYTYFWKGLSAEVLPLKFQ